MKITIAAVEDGDLSLRALGLLTYLLSRPKGWTFSAERLADQRPEGRDAILRSLKDLEAAGYLRRSKIREGGRVVRLDHEVTDVPGHFTGDEEVTR